ATSPWAGWSSTTAGPPERRRDRGGRGGSRQAGRAGGVGSMVPDGSRAPRGKVFFGEGPPPERAGPGGRRHHAPERPRRRPETPLARPGAADCALTIGGLRTSQAGPGEFGEWPSTEAPFVGRHGAFPSPPSLRCHAGPVGFSDSVSPRTGQTWVAATKSWTLR